MQFVVTAYDGTDAQAEARRLGARPAHLAGIKPLIERGSFINGGAILDDEGKMIGSTLYVEFPSMEALKQWLEADPYYVQGVWKEVEVKPIRLVPIETLI